MQVIPAFDPSAAIAGSIDVGAADAGSKILLYNLSLINILINFNNGKTDLLHSGEAKWWALDGDTPTLDWKQYSIVPGVPSISQITATLYGADETISGTYPATLLYQMSVANTVPIQSNVAMSNIVNDGNAAGTSIIEATPSGATASQVQLSNSGKLTLGDTTSYAGLAVINGYIQSGQIAGLGGSSIGMPNGATVSGAPLVVQGQPIRLDNSQPLQVKDIAGNTKTILIGSNTNKTIIYSIGDVIQFRDVNNNVIFTLDPVNSALVFSGAANIGHDSGTGNVISATNVNTHIAAGTGQILFDMNGNVGAASIDSSGHVHTPQILLSQGGLSRLSLFGGTGTATVAHGLGAQPTIVLAIATGSNSATFGYSAGSTNCTITCGASVPWLALAVGF